MRPSQSPPSAMDRFQWFFMSAYASASTPSALARLILLELFVAGRISAV